MLTEIGKYVDFIKERCAVDISVYDLTFLRKAIESRIDLTGCNTEEDYLAYLDQAPDESGNLLSLLSNSYSEFFRNLVTFSMLEQVVIPKIFDEKVKNNAREIRIWSAGCASGQEPYSLAMLLSDFKNTRFPTINFRIFATDNSVKELDLARIGVFDFVTVKNTRLEFVERYFSRNGDTYQLNKMLKEQVDFSVYDLLDKDSSSPPASIYGDFDLIMCSNVLFYYEPEYQQIILQKIYRSLKPGGFFITGEAEREILKGNNYHEVFINSAIFQKRG